MRSPDGTPSGYVAALLAAGFTKVDRIDLDAPGSRSCVLAALREAKAARERICVHCADGTSKTGVVMADWLVNRVLVCATYFQVQPMALNVPLSLSLQLSDYIGGDNIVEATDALRARKRLGGARTYGC